MSVQTLGTRRPPLAAAHGFGTAHVGPAAQLARNAVTGAGPLRYNDPMHVYSYKVKLEPMLWSPPALTPELLAGRLAGDAVIREFASHPSGAHVVNIGLHCARDSHEEALNELLLAAQELGYAFAEAEITKIADRAIETAVAGLGGGGLGAGSATQNGELAVIGAFVGNRSNPARAPAGGRTWNSCRC
jgi:hypothetical protein